MTGMRITSKGQVTIPQAIRERYGLLPDTDVEFVVSGGRVTIGPGTVDRTTTEARRRWPGCAVRPAPE